MNTSKTGQFKKVWEDEKFLISYNDRKNLLEICRFQRGCLTIDTKIIQKVIQEISIGKEEE